MGQKSIVLLSSLIIVGTNAKLGRLYHRRKLSPYDVGVLHNEAFHKLGEKYAREKPRHRDDVINDISSITSSYCPIGDKECLSDVNEKITNESKIVRFGYDVDYPDDFDLQVKEIIDDAAFTIEMLNSENVEETLHDLSVQRDTLENLEGSDLKSQMIGIAAVSVGIESTRLWHEVVTEESHPLHDMIGYFNSDLSNESKKNGSNRMLEQTDDAFLYYGWIVLSDMGAALQGGFQSNVANAGFVSVLSEAVMGSAQAAFFEGYYYDDVGGDDPYYRYDYQTEVDTGDDDDFLNFLFADDDDGSFGNQNDILNLANNGNNGNGGNEINNFLQNFGNLGNNGEDINEGNEGSEVPEFQFQSELLNFGNKGNKGNKEEDGNKGNKGNNGEDVNKGNKGNKGEGANKGNKGNKGEDANKGNKGNKGEDANKGNKGNKGEGANKGNKGNKGEDANKGNKGNKGGGANKGNKGNKGRSRI